MTIHLVPWRRIFAAHILSGLLCTLAFAEGPGAPSRDSIRQRSDAVSTLVELSSGAKQVEASGNPAARSRQAAARVLHRAADSALREEDLANASGLLDAAVKAMFEAVRLAAPEQIEAAKERRDFDARMESTRALLEAQRRIGKEKGHGKADEHIKQAEAFLARAESLSAAGDLRTARVELDQAYQTVKAAVRGLRGGDTLVRSLNFANKEEEYRYELDRNDTHLMLVNILLAEKRASAAVNTLVQRALDDAARLRKSAEASAATRDFDSGIRFLEDSTRELVRAIRGAGVYIPG